MANYVSFFILNQVISHKNMLDRLPPFYSYIYFVLFNFIILILYLFMCVEVCIYYTTLRYLCKKTIKMLQKEHEKNPNDYPHHNKCIN